MSVVAKTCLRCQVDQPPENFSFDQSRSDGLNRYCRSCRSEKGRKAYASNPAMREASKARASAFNMLKNYGMTMEDYEALLDRQGGGCAICGQGQTDRRNARFCIDHDHETGQVRGLLCTPCNLMVGYAKDDVARLASAIHYLNGAK